MKRSFIPVEPHEHFPIQNLPYGVFSTTANGPRRIGSALGNFVVDLAALQQHGLLPGTFFQAHTLNPFLATGHQMWHEVRATLQSLLDIDNPTLRDDPALRSKMLIPMQDVTLHLPVAIGDYTDFYSSRQHAENMGKMFRDPNNPLLPNWLHIPIAYHGRASSVVVSGTPIRRPCGQMKAADAPAPVFGPSRMLDIELELGVIIGSENQLGAPIPVAEAHQFAFGMVLLNDWSARDIQRWEYEPLGPFLGKNFATSISPWVVPMAALEEFRVPLPVQQPPPLPYLHCTSDWGYDIELEIALTPSQSLQETRIAHTNFRTMYWSIAQQIAHHSSNGCNLKRGDLLGSGTVSGSDPGTYGSLLELTWRGTQPLTFANGEQRTFLQDGDSVQLRGCARGNGYTIGFGEVTGTILPSLAPL